MQNRYRILKTLVLLLKMTVLGLRIGRELVSAIIPPFDSSCLMCATAKKGFQQPAPRSKNQRNATSD